MTENYQLLQPMVGMMLLTLCVWCYMYFLRNKYVIVNRINPQKISSPEQITSLLPERVNQPSNNLKNLFELPLIFYIICLSATLLGLTDVGFIGLAWCYLGLRVLHSVIHCSFNHVLGRFCVYFLSGIVLWIMVIKFSLVIFGLSGS